MIKRFSWLHAIKPATKTFALAVGIVLAQASVPTVMNGLGFDSIQPGVAFAQQGEKKQQK